MTRPSPSRLDYQLALAHAIERQLADDTVPSYAGVARILGLTRARLTQVINLLHLSPTLQAAILLGRLRGSERALRSLSRSPDWNVQEHARPGSAPIRASFTGAACPANAMSQCDGNARHEQPTRQYLPSVRGTGELGREFGFLTRIRGVRLAVSWRMGVSRMTEYLAWLFGPFFRWWWALLTGFASLVGFAWTPQAGVHLSAAGMACLLAATFTLTFLALTVTLQGWKLHKGRWSPFEVIHIRAPTELQSELVFVLRGPETTQVGTLLSVRRDLGDIEVPFALLRVETSTLAGKLQAIPVWTSPGHLNDLSQGKFTATSVRVDRHLSYDETREALTNANA